jgi:hypothetical protein
LVNLVVMGVALGWKIRTANGCSAWGWAGTFAVRALVVAIGNSASTLVAILSGDGMDTAIVAPEQGRRIPLAFRGEGTTAGLSMSKLK